MGAPPRGPTPAPQRFPIVGIAASAGGLEAFQALLKALPRRTGLAYVLIQHQAPLHVSLLPGILSRFTAIPVSDAVDGQCPERDHLYVIPSHADLVLSLGVFRLVPRQGAGRGVHLPADLFFRSLAAEVGPLAVGVVLSGMGNDGTEGVRAIGAGGGATFALDPDVATYPSMPRSALIAGGVDHVLPIEELAGELVRLGRRRRTPGPRRPQESAVGKRRRR